MNSLVHSRSALIPTCAAVLVAALLAGCTVREAGPAEPERFKRHTLAVESSVGAARAGIVEDRLTGCLYSFTYDDGVSAITLPNGDHAGCKPTTALESPSVGTKGEARSAPNQPGETSRSTREDQ